MLDYKYGDKLPVEGDEHGYVILRDVMGDDADIANSARISYDYQGPSKDRGLLRYLMRHKHSSPFEMAELKFEIKMPIFVCRQWIRHRTANVNEMSARYTVLPSEMFVPEELHLQSDENNQGREGHMEKSDESKCLKLIDWTNEKVYAVYEELLEAGVTRELARGVLPLNVYTKMVWKIDLHNLFHFLKLRLDPHAQKEIRVYAEVIEKLVALKFPLAYEAFVDYSKESYTLSRMERYIVKEMLAHYMDAHEPLHSMMENEGMSEREQTDFKKRFLNG